MTTTPIATTGWNVVRSIQEMCESLRQSETAWSAQHFAELKQPRWLLLSRTLQQQPQQQQQQQQPLASFETLRPKVLAAWERWLSVTTDFAMPPAALVSTPVPLGTLVLQSVTNPTTPGQTSLSDEAKTWVAQFAKKPADIQLLFWLHLLTPSLPANAASSETELTLWNTVTVIQNSPLPFLTRAKLTLLAYKQFPTLNNTLTFIQSTVLVTATALNVAEMGRMAEQGGVGEHWWRCLWESASFTSTPAELQSEIRTVLVGRKAPDSEKVYTILAKLDKQNQRRKPFQSAAAVVAYMLHLTHILSILTNNTFVIDTLTVLLQLPLKSSAIVKLAQTLHLHSLMTLAQIRRAVTLFWTLFYAIQSVSP